jgi:hypothetical protein
MTADFILNIVAGLALLALGFISRQLVARFQTRATRRLWRGFSGKAGLTIAMTNWKGPTPRSGTRTSFGEVRVLITLVPTLEPVFKLSTFMADSQVPDPPGS